MTLLDADIKPDQVLGEDTWDLFGAIECSFGIDLGVFRSHYGTTIRDLAAEVERLANYPNADKCRSAVAFYRLRRTLQQFGFSRNTVRPATSLRKLLPCRNRRRRVATNARSFRAGVAWACSAALCTFSSSVRTRNHPHLHEGVLGNPAKCRFDSFPIGCSRLTCALYINTSCANSPAGVQYLRGTCRTYFGAELRSFRNKERESARCGGLVDVAAACCHRNGNEH